MLIFTIIKDKLRDSVIQSNRYVMIAIFIRLAMWKNLIMINKKMDMDGLVVGSMENKVSMFIFYIKLVRYVKENSLLLMFVIVLANWWINLMKFQVWFYMSSTNSQLWFHLGKVKGNNYTFPILNSKIQIST